MNSKANNCYEDLIDTLKDEIKFLRHEIVSKDKIIELMVKEKFNDYGKKCKFCCKIKRNKYGK